VDQASRRNSLRPQRGNDQDLPLVLDSSVGSVAARAYPFHDKTVTVTTCGRLCFNRQKINLSGVFAGQNVGIKQVSDRIWLVTFMDYDLGYFDDETCRLEPLDNPFGPKVLPMSQV
jgi:putative transposase